MNRLADELSSSMVGCHIDGVCVNNISYADDMVLLSPSIRALMSLLQICESYAHTPMDSGTKCYNIMPNVTLCGAPLKVVSRFKYLGHWITDDLSDNVDIERERRSLWVIYTRRTYNGLRVQYNNAFRVLLGLPRYCSASGMFAEAGNHGRVCSHHAQEVRHDSSMFAHWMRLHTAVA
ncbi:uncharacterized protein LOC113227690 [Hyposmocoma kahamanoa]|uniref:uncharacterized protein LOC113227690 n=1 Tax=Hyposmocoma kahamanoa TaxID=1477025 RepID=UPI000E6D6BD4|nr:uncharacterized protein LOC113227690 [Hyposmocoma kahamanoa]